MPFWKTDDIKRKWGFDASPSFFFMQKWFETDAFITDVLNGISDKLIAHPHYGDVIVRKRRKM
jgi:hypothetical protein